MFNKSLSGINKRPLAMETDKSSDNMPDIRDSEWKLYHPKRHVKLKIISAICVVTGCLGVAFLAGSVYGSAGAGATQYAAEQRVSFARFGAPGPTYILDESNVRADCCWFFLLAP